MSEFAQFRLINEIPVIPQILYSDPCIQEAKTVGDEFLALEKYVNLNYLVSSSITATAALYHTKLQNLSRKGLSITICISSISTTVTLKSHG